MIDLIVIGLSKIKTLFFSTSISLSTTMSGIDHTKSLVPYKTILESFEQDYRDADVDGRSKVIDEICMDIMGEAKANGARVADEDDLQKECCVLAIVTLLTTYISH